MTYAVFVDTETVLTPSTATATATQSRSTKPATVQSLVQASFVSVNSDYPVPGEVAQFRGLDELTLMVNPLHGATPEVLRKLKLDKVGATLPFTCLAYSDVSACEPMGLEHARQIVEFLHRYVDDRDKCVTLVAHNAMFDKRVVMDALLPFEDALARVSFSGGLGIPRMRWLCTLILIRSPTYRPFSGIPDTESRSKLGIWYEAVTGAPLENAHSADADTNATAWLAMRMFAKLVAEGFDLRRVFEDITYPRPKAVPVK